MHAGSQARAAHGRYCDARGQALAESASLAKQEAAAQKRDSASQLWSSISNGSSRDVPKY